MKMRIWGKKNIREWNWKEWVIGGWIALLSILAGVIVILGIVMAYLIIVTYM